jgi:hypothetical protein
MKPRAARIAAVCAAGAALLAAVVVMGGRSLSSRPVPAVPLTGAELVAVYGVGDGLGVTVAAGNEQVRFHFDSPDAGVPSWYVLEFAAHGPKYADDVELLLNGSHVSNVALAEIGQAGRHRIGLPREQVRPGANELIVRGEKGSQWAVSKVRLNVKHPEGYWIPREPQRLYETALKLWDRRELAPENRFRAWTNLHRALLFLESVDPKPHLDVALAMLHDLDRELDEICSKALEAGKRFEDHHDPARALMAYQDGLAFFPADEDEHSCRARLMEKTTAVGGEGASILLDAGVTRDVTHADPAAAPGR